MNIAIIGRRCAGAAALAVGITAVCAASVPAQTPSRDTIRVGPETVTDSALRSHIRSDSVRNGRGRFYRRFAAGAAASILLHEAAHVGASYALGFHPHFGFDKGRPTIFSGIDEFINPRQQFIFSAAGLTVQNVLDEILLDVPHPRGGAFERGLLAGGLGTTLFYVTIGRNARVSDITVMDRTSHLSRSQLSMIFGSVAALDAFRMSRNKAYSRFFVAPGDRGKDVQAGISIRAP